MKREAALEAYYKHSEKLSDVCRQLCFAGIGIVWLFKSETQPLIGGDLRRGALAIVVALALDFLQYAYGSAAWSIFNRHHELRDVALDDHVIAPRWINWIALALFWGKALAVAVAYTLLLKTLALRV